MAVVNEVDSLEPHIHAIVKTTELARIVNALPDEYLVASIDLLGDRTGALSTLANVRDALAVLLAIVSRAHDRVLAASPQIDDGKPN